MSKSFIKSISRAFKRPEDEYEEPLSVDFVSEAGKMFILIQNEVHVGLREVSVLFDQKLIGPSGKSLNNLNIFKNLSYLSAGRKIEIFAGRTDIFLNSLKNSIIEVTLSMKLPNGKKLRYCIEHDLSIYTDLPQIIKQKKEK